MLLRWLQLEAWPLPVGSGAELHPQRRWPLCSRVLELPSHKWSEPCLQFPAEGGRQKRGEKHRSETKVPYVTLSHLANMPTTRPEQKQGKQPVALTLLPNRAPAVKEVDSPFLCDTTVQTMVLSQSQARKPTESWPKRNFWPNESL